ncbi:TPA: Fic family protein [Clostridioides difficile]|nr:Fic family protein [Clostridioides difficile]HBF9262874.1 Fic family protein [Clostridioides difficile]HBF9359996.1 Fic family protein [Clostridioides difficile]HBG1536288.1 Fic family protein [Clostridioides difficile]HCU2754248.1 Fic family protein [Clostridioides difficile]
MQNREFNFDYIKDIHKHIFGDIYDWAGETRKINIEKSEKVLNGMSVEYCDYTQVEKEVNKAIEELKNIEWKELDLDERSELFSKKISNLWKVHAFREGNTRTIMTFSVQIDFRKQKGSTCYRTRLFKHKPSN